MATASTLMMERSGRCSRLARISLFSPEDDSERQRVAGNALTFRVTAQGRRSRAATEAECNPPISALSFQQYPQMLENNKKYFDSL
jgi:hypothetical protein